MIKKDSTEDGITHEGFIVDLLDLIKVDVSTDCFR